jgi:hypothetical protein
MALKPATDVEEYAATRDQFCMREIKRQGEVPVTQALS